MKIEINEIVSNYSEIKGVHTAAELFPLPSEDDFQALVTDIKNNGLLRPIMYTEDTHLLLDGRSRLMACNEAQVKPIWEQVDKNIVPYAFSCSMNLSRRHLTAGQKAIIGTDLISHFAKEAKERQLRTKENREKSCGGNISTTRTNMGKSRDKAAKAVGISGKSIDKATKIKEQVPELFEDVKNGKITLEFAYKEAVAVEKSKPIMVEQRPSKKEMCTIITHDGQKIDINRPLKPVFNKTNENVDWAEWTWNPVTGCLYSCDFCYAKDIANNKRTKHLFPLGFKPVFHEYRLEAPKNTPVNGRVFVCSMADLFGKWVPDEWIDKVINACMEAPEWEYMFLTKWPNRYKMLEQLPKAWFGASVIKQSDVDRVEREMQSFETNGIKWISLEPMLEPIKFNDLTWCDQVVIGSQTAANGQPAFAPDFDWVVDVVNQCREAGVPYYLKPNLMEISPGMKLPRDLTQLGMKNLIRG